MGIVSVTNDGVMQVVYDTITPLPNETHILQAAAGGKWTFLANGTTGLITVTDGATGTPENIFYVSPDGGQWRLLVNDVGTLFLSDATVTRIFSPVGNEQTKTADGAIASDYSIATLETMTGAPAVTWGARTGFVFQPNPIPLDALGFPTLPIFIEIGVIYDFVLLDGLNQEVYRWNGVSAGSHVAIGSVQEWIGSTNATFINATQFSLPMDQREAYATGRRVKVAQSSGFIYATISGSSYQGNKTTVTVIVDAGTPLTDPIGSVSRALLTSVESSVPDRKIKGLETDFVNGVNIKTTEPFNLLPPAIVCKFGTTIPPRWLLCDGQSYLRADYPELFGAIDSVFGSVDATHFNVPDLRGRMELGKDNMGGTASGRVTAASLGGGNAQTLGGVGGEQVHVLTIAELAAHDHGIAGVTIGYALGSNASTMSGTPITSTVEGGNVGHNTMPPWLSLNKAIWAGATYVLGPTAFSHGYSVAFY